MNQKGQAAVEYIMLTLLVVTIAISVFNSSYFKDFFGDNGTLADAFQKEMEYSYRNGDYGQINFNSAGNLDTYTDTRHPLYFNSSKSMSRFFGPKEIYPAP
jgi:uncharacterized protein (UPF0333 family)